jgi:hypothetical protein
VERNEDPSVLALPEANDRSEHDRGTDRDPCRQGVIVRRPVERDRRDERGTGRGEEPDPQAADGRKDRIPQICDRAEPLAEERATQTVAAQEECDPEEGKRPDDVVDEEQREGDCAPEG